VRFETGSKLVLYSDGLFEVRGEDGEYYGVERLADRIASLKDRDGKTMIDSVVRDVDRFWDGKSDRDDVAIVVIEFAG